VVLAVGYLPEVATHLEKEYLTPPLENAKSRLETNLNFVCQLLKNNHD